VKSVNVEALVAVARLEQARKAPLDEGSVKLLARHASEWRHLFPYFERLPGLIRAEFEALESFVSHVRAQQPSRRNLLLGNGILWWN